MPFQPQFHGTYLYIQSFTGSREQSSRQTVSAAECSVPKLVVRLLVHDVA